MIDVNGRSTTTTETIRLGAGFQLVEEKISYSGSLKAILLAKYKVISSSTSVVLSTDLDPLLPITISVIEVPPS